MVKDVILYARFSSAGQADGDSLRRQREAAQRYCAEHGLAITREIVDEGVSAYYGRNLGVFDDLQLEVMNGLLSRGSVVIVEDLDRFSREKVGISLFTLLGLVFKGISLVNLKDGQLYTEENISDLRVILPATLELSRAREESERKSTMVGNARSAARTSRNRSQFTWPGWLEKKDGQFVPIPEMVESVRRVFEFVAEGHGTTSAAARANAGGWPVPSKRRNKGSGWHLSMVRRLIRSRAVLGEHEFHLLQNRKRIPTGDVVTDWYPTIIDEELYLRANASMDSRSFAKGKHAIGAANPFRGLLFCGNCGSGYAFHPGEYSNYSCRGRVRGICKSGAISQRLLLGALLPKLIESWSEHFDSRAKRDRMTARIKVVEPDLIETERRIANIKEAIEVGEDVATTFIPRLRELQDHYRSKKTEVAALRAGIASLPQAVTMDATSILCAFKKGSTDEALRAEFGLRMQQLVSKLLLFPKVAVVAQVNGLSAPLVLPLTDHRGNFDADSYLKLLLTPLDFPGTQILRGVFEEGGGEI